MPDTDRTRAAIEADAAWWAHVRRCFRCADGSDCRAERELERHARSCEAHAYGVAA